MELKRNPLEYIAIDKITEPEFKIKAEDSELYEKLKRSIIKNGQIRNIVVCQPSENPDHFICLEGTKTLSIMRVLGEKEVLCQNVGVLNSEERKVMAIEISKCYFQTDYSVLGAMFDSILYSAKNNEIRSSDLQILCNTIPFSPLQVKKLIEMTQFNWEQLNTKKKSAGQVAMFDMETEPEQLLKIEDDYDPSAGKGKISDVSRKKRIKVEIPANELPTPSKTSPTHRELLERSVQETVREKCNEITQELESIKQDIEAYKAKLSTSSHEEIVKIDFSEYDSKVKKYLEKLIFLQQDRHMFKYTSAMYVQNFLNELEVIDTRFHVFRRELVSAAKLELETLAMARKQAEEKKYPFRLLPNTKFLEIIGGSKTVMMVTKLYEQISVKYIQQKYPTMAISSCAAVNAQYRSKVSPKADPKIILHAFIESSFGVTYRVTPTMIISDLKSHFDQNPITDEK